jgi:branched-chain amino acid transport system permease protein
VAGDQPVIHLRGDYLCIVTIGIGEIVRLVAERDPFGLTRGANGITGIDPIVLGPLKLDSSASSYFFIWAVLALVVLALLRLQKSRQGRAWNYIREDEIAAGAMGVDVKQANSLAFVLGAALAASPETSTRPNSRSSRPRLHLHGIHPPLLHRAPGRTRIHPRHGARRGGDRRVPEIFRDAAQYRMLLFGAALAAMMIFKPAGLLPGGVGTRPRGSRYKTVPPALRAPPAGRSPPTWSV